MDPAAFDALSRRLGRSASRRTMIASVLTAIAPLADVSGASKRRKQKTKCVKLGAACGGKRKCCAGECRHHACVCPFNQNQCGNKCISSSGCCTVAECHETLDPCLDRVCASNQCATKPNPGTLCEGGFKRCNEAGHCVAVTCQLASDCPGDDTVCRSRVCKNGQCEFAFAGQNTFVTGDPKGDCQQVVCNGVGGTMTVADIDDPPAASECAAPWCDGGFVVPGNKPAGTPCGGGARQCDGAGRCL